MIAGNEGTSQSSGRDTCQGKFILVQTELFGELFFFSKYHVLSAVVL